MSATFNYIGANKILIEILFKKCITAVNIDAEFCGTNIMLLTTK